ncbi:phosphatidylinositol 3,4,5-trisphosphate 3-phosphatase TPTE2-like isoform X2 [Daphnia pulex]|uniref:phosphatidylinositol 3,4,5-trisphosphate 3-phosphatase TPTE2-like isoform X2 n=1 Tax=Daphnia pulex TaxID=6669 RepID=UPI001EDE3320|nr:phosphatidylinositol 3,4,5-trisphosphate 3-phosphatase TPTE2-like isoform X2 [Daphnia pulex]
MSSNALSGGLDNPCFVIDSPELSIQSLQELGTQHIQIDSGDDAQGENFDCASSLSNGSEKYSLENAPPVLTRTSISTSTTSSAPLEHLENFLSDARSSLDDSPVAALRRLSVVKFDPPEEGYLRSPIIWKLDRLMQSFPVNLLTTLCILSDLGVVVADVIVNSLVYQIEVSGSADSITNGSNVIYVRDNYVITDFILSVYLLIELLLRIVAVGLIPFVQQWHNDLDALVTFSTFIFSLVDLIVDDTPTSNGLQYRLLQTARLCRLFRIVRVFRIFTMQRRLANAARLMVSRNKRRYQYDGFDLDLTYVTDKIIAMSFPSSGKMSFYRNPMSEVVRLLDTKHPNRYKVYNLCSEHSYSPSYFHGRVANFPIDDHNVPTCRQMIEFTTSVRNWLESDPNNVIAVHCKGGKGRTGTMICVWLVEAELFLKAEDSLVYFGSRRTDTRYGHSFQGVETPSQCRYVHYYERIKENGGDLPPDKKVHLRKIRMEGISQLGKGDGSDFTVEVYDNRGTSPVFQADFRKQHCCQTIFLAREEAVECLLSKAPPIQGDVQIIIRHRSRSVPRGYMNAVLYFWFNCSFIENNRLRLKREELDNPHKSNTWRYFTPDFVVQLDFSECNRIDADASLSVTSPEFL